MREVPGVECVREGGRRSRQGKGPRERVPGSASVVPAAFRGAGAEA